MKCDHLFLRAFILLGAAFVPAAASPGEARFLYLENCGGTEIPRISIEVQKTDQGEWVASGQKWPRLPLLENEAACFDLADMYSAVPNGASARLKIEFETGDAVTCAPVRVDKSKTGGTRIYTHLSLPVSGDTFYYDQGCHAQAHLKWQPTKFCSGKGERLQNIQCQF